MIFDSSRICHFLRLAGWLLLVILVVGLFTTGFSTDITLVRHPSDEKERFIQQFLQHEVEGPFDGSAIAELCASKTWTEGLILSCDPAAGSVAPVKNAHLHCIRFAMEMGGQQAPA